MEKQMENKVLSFEEGMAQIEQIVKKLDTGNVTLDESLRLFEEGSRLIHNCSQQLKGYEQRVVRLVKGADGAPQEVSFEEA